MAPLGTKAIIYEDSDTRTSWAPHGLDAWFLGSSKDHYRCHLYFVPETSGYRVSGSAELLPQHCIAPHFSNETHVNELSEEIKSTLPKLAQRQRTLSTLCALAQQLDSFVAEPSPTLDVARLPDEQRVMPLPSEQRVSTPLQRLTTTVSPNLANNPTAPRVIRKKEQRTHKHRTQANKPGSLPAITRNTDLRILPLFTEIEPDLPLTFTSP
jgi:hypothetical protein